MGGGGEVMRQGGEGGAFALGAQQCFNLVEILFHERGRS